MSTLAESAFEIASYLTDPICMVREYAYRGLVIDELRSTNSKVTNTARRCFYWLASLIFSV